jgi:hypothetical protein
LIGLRRCQASLVTHPRHDLDPLRFAVRAERREVVALVALLQEVLAPLLEGFGGRGRKPRAGRFDRGWMQRRRRRTGFRISARGDDAQHGEARHVIDVAHWLQRLQV